MSFVCAVGATMVQEWIRRYQLLTQLWSRPPRSSAHIRASISQDGFLEHVPLVLKLLNTLLHLSIYYFLIGLTALPYSFNDTPIAWVTTICFVLALLGYLLFFTGYVRCRSLLFFCPLLLVYGRDKPTSPSYFRFFPTLLFAAREIKNGASTRTSTLDADAVSWLLDSLAHEEEFERFITGIPGFYKSTQVGHPAEVLQAVNVDTCPKAILAFMDRSLSSDLPELTRQRRIRVSLEAIQTHPYLLQRSFYHALRVYSTESAIFKSVDFVLLADKHANDNDLNIRSLAMCIIAIAISLLEDYHSDERWAGIVQRRLNWPEDPSPGEQRNSVKLRNLVQLARKLKFLNSGSDPLLPAVFRNSLREVCKLDVHDATRNIQKELCNLWNDLVNAAQLPHQDPDLRLNVMLILSSICAIHVALHQGTESRPSTSLPKTDDLDPALQNPSFYFQCTISHHPVTSANPNPNPNTPVAHDSGDA